MWWESYPAFLGFGLQSFMANAPQGNAKVEMSDGSQGLRLALDGECTIQTCIHKSLFWKTTLAWGFSSPVETQLPEYNLVLVLNKEGNSVWRL